MARVVQLLRFFGDVQGVGFRATCRALAQGWDLKGWVKNESDGSVAMVVSGEAGDVEAYLRAVRQSRLGAHIDREVQESLPDGTELDGFKIRY